MSKAPLVSLSRFVSTSVSRLITVTALWAVLLSFHIALMQFLLLYHYKYSLMHVHLSHTIYYNTEVLRNSKLSLLSAGGISYWERSALWPLCHPRGRFMAYSLLPTEVYMGWSTTVTDLDSHRLQWWQSQSSCCAVVYIWRYCSTHWFFHSDRPSVCGWKVVLMLQSIFSLVVSAFAKWEVKHGSLSEIIFTGTPNQGNMCWRYNLAIPSPVIVVLHGRNTMALKHPWSMMVSFTSWLLDHGSWVMRSITTVLKWHSVRSPGMWYKGVLFFVVHILFCWHVAHPLMYWSIHAFIFGHQ